MCVALLRGKAKTNHFLQLYSVKVVSLLALLPPPSSSSFIIEWLSFSQSVAYLLALNIDTSMPVLICA